MSFRAFSREIEEEYGLKYSTLKSHFLGATNRNIKGELIKSDPHFVPTKADKEGKILVLIASRKSVERKALLLIERSLDRYLDGNIPLSPRELSSLITAVNKSEDTRKMLELKRKELEKGDERFDRFLAAAMYGGKFSPSKIKDAEIIDDDPIKSIEST